MSLTALQLVEAGSLRPLKLQRIDVEIQCDAFLSHTKATMVWENPYDTKFEAELTFPLPEDGVVCGYSVDIENILVPGVIVTKEKARATFEAEVRKDRGGPAMIEQSVGNIFNTRINPFLPNGSRTIQVIFTQDLLSQRESSSRTANIYSLPFLTPTSTSCYATMSISVPGNFIPRIVSPHTFIDERTDREPQWCQTKDDQIGKYFSTFYGTSSCWSLTSPFIVHISASNVDSSLVIDHCGPNTISIAANINEIPLGSPSSPSLTSSWSTSRIGVLWDISKSRGTMPDARDMEAMALEAICKHFDSHSFEMDLFTFNTTPSPEPRRFFSKHLVEASNVLKKSDGISYHGGTNYFNLNQLVGSQMGSLGSMFSSYQFWIIFTDGISTFGSQEIPDLQAPCFILSAASSGDHAFLRRWARTSNGKFWNLHKSSHAEIVKGFTDHSVSFLYSSLAGVKLITETIAVDTREPEIEPLKNRIMVVPSVPKPLDTAKLRLCARLDFSHPKLAELLLSGDGSSEITQGTLRNVSNSSTSYSSHNNGDTMEFSIHFGVIATAEVTHTHTFHIDVKQVLTMGISKSVSISERAWAQGRLNEVQVQLDSLGKVESVEKQQLEKEQLALSRHFTIVTPNTSLIVLEKLQQFLDHMICPPMALPEIYKQYNKRIAARIAEEESKRFDKTSRVHAWWQRRQKWADLNDLAHQRVLKDPETGLDEYDIAFRTHGISMQDFKANRQIFHFAEFGHEEMNDLPITARDTHNQPWHLAMPDAKHWPGMPHERPQPRTAKLRDSLNLSLDPSWDSFFPKKPSLLQNKIAFMPLSSKRDPRINDCIHILEDKPKSKPMERFSGALQASSSKEDSILDIADEIPLEPRRTTRNRPAVPSTQQTGLSAPQFPLGLMGFSESPEEPQEAPATTMTFCGVSNEMSEFSFAELPGNDLFDDFQFGASPKDTSSRSSVLVSELNESEQYLQPEKLVEEAEEDDDMGCSLFGDDTGGFNPHALDGDADEDAGEDDDYDSRMELKPVDANTAVNGKEWGAKSGGKDVEKKAPKPVERKKRSIAPLAPVSGKSLGRLAEEPKKLGKGKKKPMKKEEAKDARLKAMDSVNFDAEFVSMPLSTENKPITADFAQFADFTYTPSLDEVPSFSLPASLPLDGISPLSFGASAAAAAANANAAVPPTLPPPPDPRSAQAPRDQAPPMMPSGVQKPRAAPSGSSRQRNSQSKQQEVSMTLASTTRSPPPPPSGNTMAMPSQPQQFFASPPALAPTFSPAPVTRLQGQSLPMTESAKNQTEVLRGAPPLRREVEEEESSRSPVSLDAQAKRQREIQQDMDLAQLSQMMTDIRAVSINQETMLDSIMDNCDSVKSSVDRAHMELAAASSSSSSFGKKLVGGLMSMMGGKRTESVITEIPTVGFNSDDSERFKSIAHEHKRSLSPRSVSWRSNGPAAPSSSSSYATIGSGPVSSISIDDSMKEVASGCMGGGAGGGLSFKPISASSGEERHRRVTRSSSRNSSKLKETEKQIADTKDVMSRNIDKLLSRGEKLDTLAEQSDLLINQSFLFKKRATELKRKMWMRNIGLSLVGFVGGAVLAQTGYYAYKWVSDPQWSFTSELAIISFEDVWQGMVGIILSIFSLFYNALFFSAYYPAMFVFNFLLDMIPRKVSEIGWTWTSIFSLLLPLEIGFVLAIPLRIFERFRNAVTSEHVRAYTIIYLHPLALLEYIAQYRVADPSSWSAEISYFARWFQMWIGVWQIQQSFAGRRGHLLRSSAITALLLLFHFMLVLIDAIGQYFNSALLRVGLMFILSNMFNILVRKDTLFNYPENLVYGLVAPNLATYGFYLLCLSLGLPIEFIVIPMISRLAWMRFKEMSPHRRTWLVWLIVVSIVMAVVSAGLYWITRLCLTILSASDLVLSVIALLLFAFLNLLRPPSQSPPIEISLPQMPREEFVSVGKEELLQLEKLIPREPKRAREFSILADVDYSALPVANSPMMNQYDLVQFERPHFAYIDSTPEGTGRRILKFCSQFEFANPWGISSVGARGSSSLSEAKKRYDTFVASNWHPDETSHIGLLFELFSQVMVPRHAMESRLEKTRPMMSKSTRIEMNGEAEMSFALTAFGNLAEGHLGKVQLMRAMAYHLESVGALEEAVHLYRRVLAMRGEEPQSYRDLALVLADLNQFDECIELYDRILTRCKPDWDARFSQIEIVALTDLCGILPRMSQLEVSSGCKIPYSVVPAAQNPLQVDLRAVLTWDVDGLDLELQVLEPNGECLTSFANQSANGGMLSRDFSGGYGPVEYLVKRASPGHYAFRAKCRSPCTKPILGGQVTIRFTLYTNFGLPEQTAQTHVFRITPTMGQLIPLALSSASL